jgi:hypothetical protein
VKVLERYWWPCVALIYPLVNMFWVIPPLRLLSINFSRDVLTVVAIFGGALIEWRAHPELHLSDIARLLKALWKHPLLMIGFGLAIWVIISSFLSEDPGVALTGSLSNGSDSALSYLGLIGLMTFAYLYYQRMSIEVPQLWDFVLASGVILSVLALIEILTMRSLMNPREIELSSLPIVTFEGNGHLAGYLALVFGGAVSQWLRKNKNMIPVMVLTSLAMSICFNRTSIVASFITNLLGLRTPKLVLITALIVASGFFTGQKLLEIQRDRSNEVIAFDDQGNVSGRAYLIEMGINGLLERPVFGFGGSLFSRNWYRFLPRKKLEEFLLVAYKWKLVKILDAEKSYIVFSVVKPNGNQTMGHVAVIKAHNQLIDVGLMWGIPGIILYFALVIFGLKNLFRFRFESFAIFAYSIFSLTWFASDQAHGVLFILIGLSQVKSSALKEIL